MAHVTKGAQGVAAPRRMRNKIASLLRSLGEAATAKRLGISRQTLVRVVGGMPVRNGTLALIGAAIRDPS